MAKGAAARAAARKQRDKWKSKRWYTIRAPRHPWAFKVIGETIAEDEAMLIGRNYEILQNELDGDFSKMHVKVQFRITSVVGGDALTEYIGHEMLKDHIRRQVRRDRGKVDDTVDIVTEDGFYVRVKPLLISRNRIKGSQKQEMRTLAREVILKTGATTTWIDLQKSSLDGTLEAKIREAVSKIQPVRGVMIRRTQLIQTGVVTQDGLTLEEIRNQEEAEKEAAAEPEAEDLDSAEETESPEQEEESEAEAEEDATVPEPVEEAAAEPEAVSDAVDYSSMTVAQLKDLLREAGKTVSGKKAELIERLQE
ncbi:SAP domain-containing protein [Candidatus Thalassarchaeum betae]|jgi:small subunit ribosomal protein S3Ae|uniref:SAP domain-containing protein n=1 Tax=Candidatus Thalassarchaeum betae TaxID=2599289 RepID=UPI0030C68C7B|nr:hypothetical protein [Candidatus Thalassoarchaea betae]|tara:strand:- start:527 stop:1453 length:927 start_codon:yes stop_codon:yes gene_type:complete